MQSFLFLQQIQHVGTAGLLKVSEWRAKYFNRIA